MKYVLLFLLFALSSSLSKGAYLTNPAQTFKEYPREKLSSPSQISVKSQSSDNKKVFKCGTTEIILNYGKNQTSAPYVLQGSKWRATQLTYRIQNYPSYLNPRQVVRAIGAAFTIWSSVSPLSFKQTRNEAHINIAFVNHSHGDNDPFDGPWGTLAHAFYPIYGGAIHFDNSERWSIGKPCWGCVDLLQVATHEIGHVLGLEHSKIEEAVMYAAYRYKSDFKLHRDDVRGIQALYGRRFRRRVF